MFSCMDHSVQTHIVAVITNKIFVLAVYNIKQENNNNNNGFQTKCQTAVRDKNQNTTEYIFLKTDKTKTNNNKNK